MDDYVAKPIRSDELRRSLADLTVVLPKAVYTLSDWTPAWRRERRSR